MIGACHEADTPESGCGTEQVRLAVHASGMLHMVIFANNAMELQRSPEYQHRCKVRSPTFCYNNAIRLHERHRCHHRQTYARPDIEASFQRSNTSAQVRLSRDRICDVQHHLEKMHTSI
jgi:hypothetical protein